MNWELYSFIVRPEQRKMIINSLKEPKTPTQISKDVKVSTSHVSRTLSQFIERGLVRCLTPGEKVGKVYKLTEEGKELTRGA